MEMNEKTALVKTEDSLFNQSFRPLFSSKQTNQPGQANAAATSTTADSDGACCSQTLPSTNNAAHQNRVGQVTSSDNFQTHFTTTLGTSTRSTNKLKNGPGDWNWDIFDSDNEDNGDSD